MPSGITEAIGLVEQAVQKRRQALSEYDSKRLVAAYGIPVAEGVLANDLAGVLKAVGQFGYPVAVKACSSALMHKSDQGLVFVNVDDESSVRSAVDAIDKAVGQMADAAAFEGYLVQRMVHGRREMIVGGTRDQLFGACVMLGVGGVLVEAMADIAFRLAPLECTDALEMIQELRAQRMFDAVRGEPPVDREALAAVLTTVGRILSDLPHVSQVDVNPLIIEDGKPVAADALITLDAAEPTKGASTS